MDIKELAEKIYTDIQGRQTSTTSILRDTRTLGKMLGNNEFDWVENELKGYAPGKDDPPQYRYADAIESKTWITHLDTTLQKIYSDYLKEQSWTKWLLYQPASELEDLLSTGYIRNTGNVVKSLGFSGGKQTPIYQVITINTQGIKKVLDQIQDRVQEQVAGIIAKPAATTPSTAIFLIYIDKFPQIQRDLEVVSEFIETKKDPSISARSCRPALHALIRALVTKNIPKKYVFTDGQPIAKTGEKSKMKYYIEQKGEEIFGDKKKIIDLDNIFREVYDLASKADKSSVNLQEANYCIDKFLVFLEQLYRYTDLEPVK